MLNFFNSLFRKETPQPEADVLNYIPFQFVKDWEKGDKITVAGEPATIYDVVPRKSPAGKTVASIGVMYDDEPGVVRLVDFDFHLLKQEHRHSPAAAHGR